MLTIDAQVVGKSGQSIDVKVSITASGGSSGIESVGVTSIDYKVLATQSPNGCPNDYSFLVKAVPLTALPLYIEGTECQAGVDQGQTIREMTFSGPLLRDQIGIVDCKAPGQNQNNQACINLQNSIQTLRNSIFIQCADAQQLERERNGAAAAAAVLSAAIAICLYAAAVSPWPINLVSAALAVALLIAFVIAVYLAAAAQYKLNGVLAALQQKRSELSRLVNRLNDVCCPEFIVVPRDVPLCPN